MLIDFTIKNYLSFKDEVCFSMLGAKSVKEHDGTTNPLMNNTIKLNSKDDVVLKFAAVYGANGSGKSNLFKSLAHMRQAVLQSFLDDNLIKHLSKNVYRLDVESEERASLFEITFTIKDFFYRYGFEFKKGVISREWLFKRSEGASRESYCFKRENKIIQANPKTYKGTRGLSEKTRVNSLFLSTCAQFNIEEAIEIKEWFRKKLNIICEVKDDVHHFTTLQYQHNPKMRDMILAFMQSIDTGIKGITVTESTLDPAKDLPDEVKKIIGSLPLLKQGNELKKVDIFTEHDQFRDGKKVGVYQFTLKNESEGTQKAFDLSGPWFDTILSGGTLFVDEFGASLHTKLSIELIKLFLRAVNKSAQLIVATHDTNILRKDLLRRDQIWFTEKKVIGATDLYSLVEYKINQAQSVRNDASYSKDYLLGKYGAIPYFGNVDLLLKDFMG